MADTLTIEQRHKNMSAIHDRNTKPEILVRKFLWAKGFRYRLNHPRLPGKPDIVLRKYRTCVFVNGCFWHGHDIAIGDEFQVPECSKFQEIHNSECCKIPHTNREFWVKKIMRNKQRDIEVQQQLAEMGWHCITVWECQLNGKFKMENGKSVGAASSKSMREQTLESLVYTLSKIYLQDHTIQHKSMTYSMPEENELSIAAEDLHVGKD